MDGLVQVEVAAQSHPRFRWFPARRLGRRGRPHSGERVLERERCLVIRGGDIYDEQTRACDVCFDKLLHTCQTTCSLSEF
jgi:hypothetical protein